MINLLSTNLIYLIFLKRKKIYKNIYVFLFLLEKNIIQMVDLNTAYQMLLVEIPISENKKEEKTFQNRQVQSKFENQITKQN